MPGIGPQRADFRFPALGTGYRGEHSIAGLTEELYQSGYLYRLRNYHLIGRGRALKRRGSTPYDVATIDGTTDVQALSMYEWDTTRYLVALCNGKVYKYDGSTPWSDISGALSFGTSKDHRARFTHFYDSSSKYLIGTGPNSGRLWKWSGTGNIAVLADTTGANPNYARDVAEFRGRLWVINTQNGETLLQYSDEQQSSVWSADRYIHCSRESPGMGLCRHGQSTLLVFHQRSIHALQFDYTAGTEPWSVQPVDERIGAIATNSIVYSNGATYFASSDGFYRVRNPARPAEYIGYPMEAVWAGLSQSRLPQIEGFVRGEPWNEVIWLASNGASTEHNLAFVWNTELETWSVFTGSFAYNCAINYVNSSGKNITLAGNYDSEVWNIWGDDNNDTGDRDGGSIGAVIESTFETGLLDFRYAGIKRLREIWIDLLIRSSKNFDLQIQGINESPTVTTTQAVGTAGDRLSIDFIFDSSRFGSSDMPSQGQFKISSRARMFKLRMTERNTGAPHTINSLWFWFIPRARRFTP